MCRSSRGFNFTNNIDFYVDTTRAPCPRARNIQIDISSFIILIPTTNCCCVFYLNRDQQPGRCRVGMCRLNWTQLAPEPAVLWLFLQQSKHFQSRKRLYIHKCLFICPFICHEPKPHRINFSTFLCLKLFLGQHFFSRESDSTFTNVRPLVTKTPQQLEIIILHHSSFILH